MTLPLFKSPLDGSTSPRTPKNPAGGGQPATPTGGAQTLVDFGGVAGNSMLFMLPAVDITVSHSLNPVVGNDYYVGTWDTTLFDDPADGSSITFRSEDVGVNLVPTVRRVILIYRDIGRCTVTATVTATNDLGQLISASKTLVIGNSTPTDALLTVFFDLTVSGFRPQLTFTRNPGAGPLCITEATMVGEVEEVTL